MIYKTFTVASNSYATNSISITGIVPFATQYIASPEYADRVSPIEQVDNNMLNLISNATGGCFLIEKFLNSEESVKLLNEIISSCTFETKYFPINGKLIGMPRKITYFGTNDYSYSGVVHKKQPFPNFITEIQSKIVGNASVLKRIKKENLSQLNSCLINYYETENEYIHFHSDDEKELGPDNKTNILVVSLSLGSEREFVIKSKDKSKELKIILPNGSVLITYGDFQHKYLHSLIKCKNKCSPRLNLTFRVILK